MAISVCDPPSHCLMHVIDVAKHVEKSRVVPRAYRVVVGSLGLSMTLNIPRQIYLEWHG